MAVSTRLTGLFLLLAVPAMIVLATSGTSSVPFFLWSSQSSFLAANGRTEISDVWGAADIVNALASTMGKGVSRDTPLSAVFPPRSGSLAPEVAVAFSFDKLGSGDALLQLESDETTALSPVQAALNAAPSAVVVPYVFLSQHEGVSKRVERLFSARNSIKETVDLDDSLKCKAIAKRITEQTTLEFVSIHAESPASVPEGCMETILQAVSTYTEGRYIAFVTADDTHAPVSLGHAQPATYDSFVLEAAGSSGLAAANTTFFPGITKITSGVLLGLLVAIFLAFVFICAFCCALDVESPSHFTVKRYNIGKEY